METLSLFEDGALLQCKLQSRRQMNKSNWPGSVACDSTPSPGGSGLGLRTASDRLEVANTLKN